MTISNFNKRLLIEQIRYIESGQKLDCDEIQEISDHSAHADFEQRLWNRARCIVRQHDLAAVLSRAARLSRIIKFSALLLAALLGALGVKYAVSDSATINIYWLLLVLLGFNFLSMLLWLVGVCLDMKGLSSGLFARVYGWLPGKLSGWLSGHQENKSDNTTRAAGQADRAWLACNFSGNVGKWHLSKITHQLWLSYLSAGLLLLVLLLLVRQYDFVWGTTLLSDTVFIRLTGLLSVPLDALGLATPTATEVLDTRMFTAPDGLMQTMAAATLSAVHRGHWAQFLLGSLLCYGIVPRLLLLSLAVVMSAKSRRRFALDLYLPYYINLRQQLMPLASHGQIVDADTSPPVNTGNAAEKSTPVPHNLPVDTQWVAVELGDDINWPLQAIDSGSILGHVIDSESLSRIQQRLQSTGRPLLAVAVAAARSPDRGVQRTIASLMSNSGQRWLVLLQRHHDEPLSSKRLAAWYRLAEACDVPADHVISMSLQDAA